MARVRSGPIPVVLIVMENHGYDQIVGNPDAPYINRFAQHGTLLTNMTAVGHPSLPNYLALTSGSTQGCADDGCPRASYPADNVFHQAQGAGLRWRSWEESMPGTCATGSSGRYAVKHNPAPYFADLFPVGCSRFDRPYPARIPDRLPDLTFITPDLCNDMHDCPVATGDAWLRAHVPPLLRRGAIVVITFDEGEGDNHVFCAEVGPGVVRGRTSDRPFTHYGLLAGIERHLSLPRLANAATAAPVPLGPHSGTRG